MNIPTEPIGSIPRPLGLIEAVAVSGDDADPKLDALYEGQFGIPSNASRPQARR